MNEAGRSSLDQGALRLRPNVSRDGRYMYPNAFSLSPVNPRREALPAIEHPAVRPPSFCTILYWSTSVRSALVMSGVPVRWVASKFLRIHFSAVHTCTVPYCTVHVHGDVSASNMSRPGQAMIRSRRLGLRLQGAPLGRCPHLDGWRHPALGLILGTTRILGSKPGRESNPVVGRLRTSHLALVESCSSGASLLAVTWCHRNVPSIHSRADVGSPRTRCSSTGRWGWLCAQGCKPSNQRY